MATFGASEFSMAFISGFSLYLLLKVRVHINQHKMLLVFVCPCVLLWILAVKATARHNCVFNKIK